LEEYLSRRFLKEFCWALFGNLFTLEVITFFAISISKQLTFSLLAIFVSVSFLVVALTLYATHQYYNEDNKNKIVNSKKRPKLPLLKSMIAAITILLISAILFTKISLELVTLFVVLYGLVALLSYLMHKDIQRYSTHKFLRWTKFASKISQFAEHLTIYYIGYLIIYIILGASIVYHNGGLLAAMVLLR
jgi:heme/copper-type cytochrome/quinol oxidase subunit 2